MGPAIFVPILMVGTFTGTVIVAQSMDKKQRKKNYWKWMDDHCKKIQLNEYDNLDWQRKMSLKNLRKAFIVNGRNNQNFSYQCGMHALNMCRLMLGYDRNNQWYKHNYLHNSIMGINVGHDGEKFEDLFIIDYFQKNKSYYGELMPWQILNTYYTERAVIVLVQTCKGWTTPLHYIIVIAQSDDGHWFVVTDSSEKLYLIKDTQLSHIMRIATPRVNRYNAYRVG